MKLLFVKNHFTIPFFDLDPELESSTIPNDGTCIENGYHWLKHTKQVQLFINITSAEACQRLCQKEKRCNWFNWNDSFMPNGCHLLETKGKRKNFKHGRTLGSTGPKQCPGNGRY